MEDWLSEDQSFCQEQLEKMNLIFLKFTLNTLWNYQTTKDMKNQRVKRKETHWGEHDFLHFFFPQGSSSS